MINPPTPTFTQVKLLEDYTNYAHIAFRRAFNFINPLEISWAKGLYCDAIEHCFGVILEDYPFMGPREKRIPLLDRYILQQVVAANPLMDLETFVLLQRSGQDVPRAIETNVSKKSLIAAIKDGSIPYAEIQRMASELGRAYDFEAVDGGMTFIRGHFKAPHKK
jgi:hypothetical protein